MPQPLSIFAHFSQDWAPASATPAPADSENRRKSTIPAMLRARDPARNQQKTPRNPLELNRLSQRLRIGVT
jgi:hypothetical protein